MTFGVPMKLNRRHLFLSATAFALAPALAAVRPDTARAEDLSGLMDPGPLKDMVMGDENAPVTIIEYASMTCPHCANFHNNVYPDIKKNYLETGKAKLIFREFPLDPRAYAASMLARCADEQFYFPMTEVLFKQQDVWARVDDPRPPLLQIAKLAGFTQES
ncbi:MAG: DsbA family protein, partial [Hyphomicrobiales bacterium]|nr:DsbA family protein [Hyphomicrobiales bacterium]